jgi:hypoxanthine-DNA glycosylase
MEGKQIKMGFPPIFDSESRVLILGSFPSVKSREISFYYGHKQNRFWKMLCGYFQEEIPQTIEEKKEFLYRNKIALWDIATECEVRGSSDASIKNAKIADLQPIFHTANIEKVLLNGTLSYDLFLSKYENINVSYQKMSSTSPANPRYDKGIWWNALNEVFQLY